MHLVFEGLNIRFQVLAHSSNLFSASDSSAYAASMVSVVTTIAMSSANLDIWMPCIWGMSLIIRLNNVGLRQEP